MANPEDHVPRFLRQSFMIQDMYDRRLGNADEGPAEPVKPGRNHFIVVDVYLPVWEVMYINRQLRFTIQRYFLHERTVGENSERYGCFNG
jgi:hypothetical protein